jgi:hypothetical protein
MALSRKVRLQTVIMTPQTRGTPPGICGVYRLPIGGENAKQIEKFGKWEFGAVGYGSADLTSPIAGDQKQSRFAAGGLFGCDFGPLKVQVYATTDLVEHNHGAGHARPAPHDHSSLDAGSAEDAADH